MIESVKGIVGLSESLRLWYLKFGKDLVKLGWAEIPIAKALSALYDETKLCGLLGIHLDDGRIAEKGTRYQHTKVDRKKSTMFGMMKRTSGKEDLAA